MHLTQRLAAATVLGLALVGSVYPVAHAGGPHHAARTAPLPRCRTVGLKVTLGPGSGTAGSTFVPIRLKNVSGHTCRTGGYGGVAFVGFGNGTQIGHPAVRVHPNRVRSLVVRPGRRVTARLREVDALNFPRATCRPAKTDGLRVIPPNNTAAAFVAQKAFGCKDRRVHLLFLSPYHQGP